MTEGDTKQAWGRFRSDIKTLFEALGAATRDAKVREGTRRAARSFGSAVGQTLRQVGDEVEKAVRRPPPPSR